MLHQRIRARHLVFSVSCLYSVLCNSRNIGRDGVGFRDSDVIAVPVAWVVGWCRVASWRRGGEITVQCENVGEFTNMRDNAWIGMCIWPFSCRKLRLLGRSIIFTFM